MTICIHFVKAFLKPGNDVSHSGLQQVEDTRWGNHTQDTYKPLPLLLISTGQYLIADPGNQSLVILNQVIVTMITYILFRVQDYLQSIIVHCGT